MAPGVIQCGLRWHEGGQKLHTLKKNPDTIIWQLVITKNNKHYGLREQKDKLSACKYALNHIEIFTVLCIDYVLKGQFTVPKWFTYFSLAFSAIYPSRLFRCNLPSFGSICCTDIMGRDGSCLGSSKHQKVTFLKTQQQRLFLEILT